MLLIIYYYGWIIYVVIVSCFLLVKMKKLSKYKFMNREF